MTDTLPATTRASTPRKRPARVAEGRPDKLTDEVRDACIAAVRNHQRIEVAAELVGVDRDTFYGWLRQAARARDSLARGAPKSSLNALDKKCIEFSAAIQRAMAQSEALGARVVTQAAVNKQVTTKKTQKYVGLDDSNQPIYANETQTTEAPGDWRAMAWWLERRVGAYQLKQQVELSGKDGGPIEFATRMETIAERIKAFQAIPTESDEA